MRDIVLSIVIVGLVVSIFRYPVMGAYVWAWLSMMTPHKLTWGFAYAAPFAQIVAIVTMLVFLFTRQRHSFPLNAVTGWWLALVTWMCVTSLFSLNAPEEVFQRWLFVIKIQVMMVVTIMLIRSRRHLEILIWVVTLSVAFYGIKGGIWTVMTGGGGRVWGPPGGLISGNNELGVALVMLVPFLYYLYQVTENRLVRYFLIFAIVTTCFGIVGTQSRGALLAVIAMAVFLGIKGKHFIGTSVALGVLAVGVATLMPESWYNRMATIGNYEEDSSAMSRLYSWTTLWNLAVDRPFVGGGFASDSATIFSRYAPAGAGFETFEGAVYVAHSIYFQVLGEHGFVGLGLFLLVGISTWLAAGRLARATAKDADFSSWTPLLMRMVQVSLVGYGVGGAFLSLAYFDLPYYIVGVVVIVMALVRERATAPVETVAKGATGATPIPSR